MRAECSNVVQIEFFHVGGRNNASLKDILNECAERISDGLELIGQGIEPHSGIKTVVRFIDKDGSITQFARNFERIEERQNDLLKSFASANSLRQRWLDFCSRRLARRILRLREQGLRLAIQKLNYAIRSQREVALERFDHSFRIVRKNELHELREAVSRASGFWFFVFEPNDLLADKNNLIAHVM